MKTFLVAAAMFLTSYISFGQEQTQQPHFFAQCMLNIENRQDFDALTLDLKENPYIQVVRLDWETKRLFLLTQNVNELPLETFSSWLGNYVSTASCVQIGLHGTDQVNPYPFTNCPN
jgi:hypothetical protein